MATKTSKKSKPRRVYRNAAPARPMPRATVARPRAPDVEIIERKAGFNADTTGVGTLKALGGAFLSTLAGAFLARQDFLPPKVLTGAISGIGALVALEAPPKWQSLGVGAMAAAGGQLGFMLIDDQLIKSAEERDKKEEAAGKPAPATSAPAKRQAGDIPADALARAYERARLRMALTSDGPN